MSKEEILNLWWFLMDVKESTIYTLEEYIYSIEKLINEEDLIRYKKDWKESQL